MVRFERTGEWRYPKVGEFYEAMALCTTVPTKCEEAFEGKVWILRRVESPPAAEEPAPARPATEEAPELDYRDGEQTANVVRTLVWAASGSTGHPHPGRGSSMKKITHEEIVNLLNCYMVDRVARAKKNEVRGDREWYGHLAAIYREAIRRLNWYEELLEVSERTGRKLHAKKRAARRRGRRK